MAYQPRADLHGVPMSVRKFTELPKDAVMGSGCLTEDLLGEFVYEDSTPIWLPREYFVFEWDHDVDGGAEAAHTLRQTVPANTIILDGFFDVVEALNGTGASIAIKVAADDDILSTEAITTAGTEGLHAIVPDGSAANAVKPTADTAVVLTISGAALKAGHIIGYLRCVRGFAAGERSSSSTSS